MDHTQFDALTRALSSRRAALGGLLGGLTSLLGRTAHQAAAHNPAERCRRLPDPQKRRACLRRARAHNQGHRCTPKPAAAVCAGVRRCSGTAVNNCGRLINCTCPAGTHCLSNGSCAEICDPNDSNPASTCPPGCLCTSAPEADSGRTHCLQPFFRCQDVPQRCASTTACPVGQQCQATLCGPDGAFENRCWPLC